MVSWVAASPREDVEEEPASPAEEGGDSVAFAHKAGHLFSKKTVTRPSYCTHCRHFIFGLRKQCFECECW